MATQYPSITDELRAFIEKQHMFFVGTAAREGRVNVSPKGLDCLRVVDPNRVVWVNGTGSGNETAAHVLDNGRMTLLFCAFERKPLILRLYGKATTYHHMDPEWEELLAPFPPMIDARNVFVLDIDLVQTSCGFGVPTYDFVEQRPIMAAQARKQGITGVRQYQQDFNRFSIDGFPTGLPEEDPLAGVPSED